MARQQGPADHLAGDLLHQLVHQQDVAQALGHLLPVHIQEAVVHPVPGQRPVVRVGADALGDLVLVVGEDQVVAAAVDVDGKRAQGLLDHGRAFQVPAGTARAPGAVPHRLTGLGGLPQHEIGGVALVGLDLDPGAGDLVFEGLARERAVIGETRDVEQHVILGLIGAAGLHQPADDVEHLRDMGGGAGL